MTRKIFMGFMISLMLVCSSFADVQKFSNFSVNIPAGWKARQQGEALIIESNNGTSSLEISSDKLGESPLSDIVEKMYTQREGVDLEQDDDGDYSFSFKNSSGSESITLITEGDGYYLAITMTGFEDESVQGDFETLLDSIDWDE